MNVRRRNHLLAGLALLSGLLILVACQSDSGFPDANTTVTSGKSPNASVSGNVTYRERLALTPGARLEVELRDTSLQDTAAPLVAEQVIEDPGQVPIRFKVEYNKDDIDPRNTYSIQASIIEDDGRLAFLNDTSYDVITRGNPGKVDMLLVMVEPPPPDPASEEQPVDPNEWVKVELPIIGAEMLPPHEGDFLHVFYLQSEMENCSRPLEQSFKIDGSNIRVSLTHMVPPPASWAAPCDELLVELEEYINLEGSLEPGETYHVYVNGQQTTVFSRPRADFPPSEIALPDVMETTINIQESLPPQYSLLITYGIPAGSGCSQENGYALSRSGEGEIFISLTFHQVAPGESILCTADYPIRDISIPLAADFVPGQEYRVMVNGKEETTFSAE